MGADGVVRSAPVRVSGWLGNYDFVEATGGWLLKNIPEDRLNGCTFAVDFSDISKDPRSKDAVTENVRILSAFGTGRKYFSANVFDFFNTIRNVLTS